MGRTRRYGNQPQEHFPYSHEDDSGAPYYERVRLERSRLLTPWTGLGYRNKSRRGRWCYPSALIEHFRGRTGLEKPVSGLARPGGKRLRVIAAGDLLWQRSAETPYLTPPLFEYFASADLVLLNLETTVAPSRPHALAGLIPRLSASPAMLAPVIQLAKRTRVVLQVANNHCLDFGGEGLRTTLEQLRDAGIPAVGAALPGSEPVALLEVAGVRVGVAAFTGFVNRWWKSMPAGLELSQCRGLIADGRSLGIEPVTAAVAGLRQRGAQVVLLGLHWGHEYEVLPDPRQLVIARELAAAGVDAVLGHHPHVVQPIELLNERGARVDRGGGEAPAAGGERRCLVAYSMGNFMANMIRPDFSLGMAAEISFRVGDDGPVELDGYEARPLLINFEKGAFYVCLLDHALREHPNLALPAAVSGWWQRMQDLSLLGDPVARQLQGPPAQWSKVARPAAAQAPPAA